MSEMVKRVCAAIDGAYSHGDLSWEKCARAAIEAMREPTEEMVQAANHMTGYSLENEYIKQEWRAMIDEALK